MAASRYRKDVATIYDVFCDVGAPVAGKKLPPLLLKYPEDYNDNSMLQGVQQFAYPCELKQQDDAVQLFSFVLTDSNSQYSFGFCRYSPKTDSTYCFLSGFFWPAVFFKALNDVSLMSGGGDPIDVEAVLTKLYHTDIPNIDEYLRFNHTSFKTDLRVVFAEKIPDPNRMISIKDDKYMLEFYNAIPPRQMIAIFGSILKERRILFTGRRVSTLSSCLHACSTILYPMFWQSVFITCLPESLIDMIHAPMPYLIGVPKPVLSAALEKMRNIGDVVMIDIDEKTFESPYDDVSVLPSEVTNFLRNQLKGPMDMTESLGKVFVQALVLLFGDYRAGFTGEGTDNVTWNKDKFIESQRSSYQPYLASLLGADGVQYLERFIHDRLDLMREGHSAGDQFEILLDEMDIKNRQNADAESLQQAIQSVKENASDVMSALKYKITGIQISNKLQKLTPREIRKAAQGRKKTNGGSNGRQPMSFENIQWEQENSGSDGSDGSPKTDRKVDVPTANLIDFDSPVSTPVAQVQQTPIPYTTNGYPQIPQASRIRPMDFKSSINGGMNTFTDPFSLMESPEKGGGPPKPYPLRPIDMQSSIPAWTATTLKNFPGGAASETNGRPSSVPMRPVPPIPANLPSTSNGAPQVPPRIASRPNWETFE